MAASTLTSKGQCVIPKSIRDHMRLHAGDRIDFFLTHEGQVMIRPAVVDVRQLKGLLRRPGRRPVSVQVMNEVVRRRARGTA